MKKTFFLSLIFIALLLWACPTPTQEDQDSGTSQESANVAIDSSSIDSLKADTNQTERKTIPIGRPETKEEYEKRKENAKKGDH